MLKVKSAEVAGSKFVKNGSAATNDYKDGINGTNDQAERAIAAKDAYVAGVQDSISRGSREAGLQRVGTAKWKQKAVTLGTQRYAGGISAAKGDYVANVKPYLDTIANLDLAPRGPKGSPENYGRSQAVGVALRNQKIGA